MPSSSLSSRINAASGVSPDPTLPPGNSHNPAMTLAAGRSARSTRPSASTSATQTTWTLGTSAAVAAIDVDVTVRQVATPHRPTALADTEIDRDADVAPRHVPRHRRFVIARHRAALGRDLDAADGNRETVAVGLLARLAHRHDDTSPIGVASGDRGLDQRRIAYGQADAPGRLVRGRAGNLDGDEFLGTLAVAHDLLRKIDQHLIQLA